MSKRILAIMASAFIALVSFSGAVAENEPPVLDPGGAAAASMLGAKLGCTDESNDPVASLSWEAAQIKGSEQKVQVTIYGWDRADASPSLPADATSLEWTELRGQSIHEWRVLTLHSEGWVPSHKGSFEGTTCTKDGID